MTRFKANELWAILELLEETLKDEDLIWLEKNSIFKITQERTYWQKPLGLWGYHETKRNLTNQQVAVIISEILNAKGTKEKFHQKIIQQLNKKHIIQISEILELNIGNFINVNSLSTMLSRKLEKKFLEQGKTISLHPPKDSNESLFYLNNTTRLF